MLVSSLHHALPTSTMSGQLANKAVLLGGRQSKQPTIALPSVGQILRGGIKRPGHAALSREHCAVRHGLAGRTMTDIYKTHSDHRTAKVALAGYRGRCVSAVIYRWRGDTAAAR